MLTAKLLRRGDVVCVERGRLVIQPASGKAIPPDWEADHALTIKKEILKSAGLLAFEYESYKTGQYGKHKAGGVTLQFRSLLEAVSLYVVFNADLTRQRTTAHGKAGMLLPRGQFRVGKRSHFYRFWVNTTLPLPKRLAALHDYMGKLRGILFTGDVSGKRIDAGSLVPLNVSAAQVRALFNNDYCEPLGQRTGPLVGIFPNSSRTNTEQLPDKPRTACPDKDSPRGHTHQGLQQDTATGKTNYGKTVKRDNGYTASVTTANTDPSEQNVDEWLSDYDRALP